MHSAGKHGMGGVEDLPYQNSRSGTHGRSNSRENTKAVLVGPVMENHAKPVHFRTFDLVLFEKVGGLKLDAAGGDGFQILFSPDVLSTRKYRRAVLDHKVETRVELGKFQAKRSCGEVISTSPVYSKTEESLACWLTYPAADIHHRRLA